MNIKTLKENQIFVFGSNEAGKHLGGSARQALEDFGAIEGQGRGLQGQSYAIATLDENFQKVSLATIQAQLYILNQEAKANTELEYLLTPIGTGIAGFTLKEIKSILPKESLAKNIKLVGDWN